MTHADDLRCSGIEVSDPRRGALLIGTFCDPAWLAPATDRTVDDALGALRLDLGLPRPRATAASPERQAAVVAALADLLTWVEANDLRTGAAWSAGGEGQVAHGQMVEADFEALLALQEVLTALAMHHGVAYRVKAGPDNWKLVYFTTDPAGSTVTAGAVDLLRHLPVDSNLAVAGFHAATDGWATGFDDSIGFLRKLDRAAMCRDPKVGALQIGGKRGVRLGSGQTQRERTSAVDGKVRDLTGRLQEAERRISELNRTLDQRLTVLEINAVPQSDVAALTDEVVRLRDDLTQTTRAHDRLNTQIADAVAQIEALDSRLLALESAKSTASDTATIAGLHSDAIGAMPQQRVPGRPIGFQFNPAGQRGGVPTRPGGGRVQPRPGIRVGPTIPKGSGRGRTTAGPLQRPGGRKLPGMFGTVTPKKPGKTPKLPGMFGTVTPKKPGKKPGTMFGGRPLQAFRDKLKGNKSTLPKNWRDWLRRRHQARRTPWIPAYYPAPIAMPATDPGFGGGGFGGGGGGGWGAPGQDFSNYFDDGQDWDGDGVSDADAEWLDEDDTDVDLEAFLASLSEEELAELVEILESTDEAALSREAAAAYLSQLGQGYKGLPPGWRPGATPNTFIKPDGTPHTFGGGDYNNGNPVAGLVDARAAGEGLEAAADAAEATPEYADLVNTYAQADAAQDLAAYATDLEQEIEELQDLLAARDGDVEDLLFDLDGYDPDDAEEYGPTFQEVADWGPVAPPTDVPEAPTLASQMRWMEYPG